jgi:hypothetical protein
MKVLYFLMFAVLISSCGYSFKVKSLGDTELCQNLGKYKLHDNANGIRLTKNEIYTRDINKGNCSTIANETIGQLRPKYKLHLCQYLAAHHYRGNYEKFKETITKIEANGFADKECTTMADFYMIKLSRKKEKDQALSNAINKAAENMRRTNEQIYGRGSRFNPIYIQLQ